MAYYFLKILLALSRPLTLVLILLLCSLSSLHRQRIQLGKRLLALAFAVLLFSSSPFSSKFFMHSLERQFKPIKVSESPKADAIVVLGGTVSNAQPQKAEPDEPYGARLTSAYRLFKETKAPFILVASGSTYLTPQGLLRHESSDMKDYLQGLSVPAEAIIEESKSRNTKENFIYSQQILKERQIKKIILVTSAYHMPRSMKWFSKAGIETSPFPTEFNGNEGLISFQDLIPSASSLNDFSTALKEYLGLLVFHLFN
jgi:uncharacterized SAM-binding protein YcdF (DUF218 family)